jgi:hypothetical protein
LAVSHKHASPFAGRIIKDKEKENERSDVMQPIGTPIIPLAAFTLLFALNIPGFGQATVANPGTTTNPSTGLPAQIPAGSYQPGIGITTPNSIPAQPPNTTTPNSPVILAPNPNFTPNSIVIPNSTLPNLNPNLVPNPYSNTVQTVPFSNVNPGATNPNVTLGTQPNNSPGTPAPVGTTLPGSESSPGIGAGVQGVSPPLGCSGVQPWQCLVGP